MLADLDGLCVGCPQVYLRAMLEASMLWDKRTPCSHPARISFTNAHVAWTKPPSDFCFHSQLVALKEKDLPGYICNPANLTTLLTLREDSAVEPDQISRELCKLNETTLTTVLETMLQELNIGALLQHVGHTESCPLPSDCACSVPQLRRC